MIKKYNYIYLQGRPRAVHVFIPKWGKNRMLILKQNFGSSESGK